MTTRTSSLRYAVRPRVLGRYWSSLFMVMAGLNLLPLAAAIGFGEYRLAPAYAGVVAGFVLAGYLLKRIAGPLTNIPSRIPPIQTNESLVLVALTFLITASVATVPMIVSGLEPIDAFFEAVSGITTTGLSTLPTVEGAPRTFLLTRAWMQWYGGLGIVIFSVAMVLRPGRATLGLARSEVPENELLGSTRLYARDICVIYGGLTVAGILLVWALEGGLFDAAAFVLAAVSTGGFAPHDASLAAYASPWARSVVIGLCLAGAVPLVFYDWWRPKRQGEGARVSLVQVVALGCCCAGLIGLLLGIPQGLPWLDAVVTALSAQSTAGFSTVDVGALDPGSKLTMIVSMLLGGGIGSTAGGFKILRLLVLGKIVYIMVTRSALAPHAVSRPTLGGMSLEQDAIIEAQVIIALYVGAVVASWVPFVLYGYAPFDALFEVVSAVGTVGLSAGITGPDLETPLKLVLCADMLLGRVEIFAWLVILYPRTWLGNRRSS